ncbi:MAG: signal peptidase II [Cyanobacteriota bacterium]
MKIPSSRGGAPYWRWLALAVALAGVLLDQLSKRWALETLPPGVAQAFLPGLLNLQLVSNTGAAFSLFPGAPKLLGLVSLVVIGAVVLWILRLPLKGPWESLGLGFLLAGALGNGLDRWRIGAVVDFLALVPIQFPVFNLADVAINLAVLCLLVHLTRPRRSGDDFHG